ncbi:hypothetical protein SESBI_23322 [Sesbania bispinosa]|nr:hypothetical protein SESBI_23322 [Sesbania bispinosa]
MANNMKLDLLVGNFLREDELNVMLMVHFASRRTQPVVEVSVGTKQVSGLLVFQGSWAIPLLQWQSFGQFRQLYKFLRERAGWNLIL